jgi:hypothetical protein
MIQVFFFDLAFLLHAVKFLLFFSITAYRNRFESQRRLGTVAMFRFHFSTIARSRFLLHVFHHHSFFGRSLTAKS